MRPNDSTTTNPATTISEAITELRGKIAAEQAALDILVDLERRIGGARKVRVARAAAPTPAKKPRAPWGSKSRGGKAVEAATKINNPRSPWRKPLPEPEGSTAVAVKSKATSGDNRSATEKIYDALCEHGPMTQKAICDMTGLLLKVVAGRVIQSDQFRQDGELVKLA